MQGLTELMRHPAEGEDPVGDTVLVQLLSKWSQRAFSVANASASGACPLAQSSDAPEHALQDLSVHSDPNSPTSGAAGTGTCTGACTGAGGTAGTGGCCLGVPQTTSSGGLREGCDRVQLSSPPQSPVRMHDDPHLAFHISTCAPALVRLAPPHSRGTRGGPAGNGVQAGRKREGSEASGGGDCSGGEESGPCSHKFRRTEAGCTAGGSPAHSMDQVRIVAWQRSCTAAHIVPDQHCARPTSPKVAPFRPNKNVQVVKCLELLRG